MSEISATSDNGKMNSLTRAGRPRRAASAISTVTGARPTASSAALGKRGRATVSSQTVGTPLGDNPPSSTGSKKRSKPSTSTSVNPSTPKSRKKPPLPTSSPPLPSRPLVPLYTAPALLPSTLPFSLPDAISHLTTIDPRFGALYSHIPLKPFQPPLPPVDPFRTLVTSIIGQQVSWLAARAITGRFRALWGYEGEDGFPTPLEVSKGEVADYRGVGFSQRKAEYVIAIAEHFVSGQISTELLRDGLDEEIAKALIAVRGIGQWTVDMFLMFSLRRPDILPVGDLGVQKGLLKWALAAHGALPKKETKAGKKADAVRAKYKKGVDVKQEEQEEGEVVKRGKDEVDTLVCTPPPEDRALQAGIPPTPMTPGMGSTVKLGVLHTPAQNIPEPGGKLQQLPPTPLSPATTRAPAAPTPIEPEASLPAQPPLESGETLVVPGQDLPPPAPDVLMAPPLDDPRWDANRAAPLIDGLSVEVLKSRLSGKKVKGGAYLTPKEMEVLTDGWRPYRSIGVYYMWPAGEDF